MHERDSVVEKQHKYIEEKYMNNNLLAIIQQITTQYGEGILDNPARLKSIFSDLAKNESKPLRVAFGRCLEGGAYGALKTAPDARERAARKAALTQKMRGAHGIEPALCVEALDTLEAALYGVARQPTPPPVAQPAYQPPPTPPPAPSAAGTAISCAPAAPAAGKISRKTLIFGAAAGAGALVGELVSELFRLNENIPSTFFQLVLNVGIWAACIGLGITVALNIAQNLQLKRLPPAGVLVKTALIGIAIGIAGGAAAQIIFGLTSGISTFVEIMSRVICWGILGWGLGFGASFYVPNYPVKRAMLAGLAGGVVGGAVFRATFFIPEPFGRVIGITILGLFIGFAISFIEEALREAWITVIWGPKESVTISLGAKPIVFGSSREADVFLPSRPGGVVVPPVRAVVSLENGQAILDDKQSGQRSVVQNGSEFQLDRLRVVVGMKS